MLKQRFMKIVLSRIRIRDEYAHGVLTIDGTRVCDTLENALSMVPAGEYDVSLLKCKQYARKMLCLNAQPPCDLCLRTRNMELGTWNLEPGTMNHEPLTMNSSLPCYCPMLKPGNGIHNRLDGSILVGRYNCLGSLIHPKTTFDPLYERIRKSLSRGNQVILIIKNESVPSSNSSKFQ